jgi:membrane protein required for colicin V production
MTELDIILMAPIVFAGILGAIKGFVRQLGTILGILCAIVAALKWGSWTANQLRPMIGREELRSVIGPIVMFVMVYLMFLVAGRLLNKIINFAQMGWADRMAGCVFGAFSAAVPMGALLMLLSLYIPSSRPAISSSHTATYLMRTFELLYGRFRAEIDADGKTNELPSSSTQPVMAGGFIIALPFPPRVP